VDHEAVLTLISCATHIIPTDSAYRELHALSTSSPQLAAHDNLATLGTALHDEPQHTVARPPHSQTVQQLVPERLALGDGGETAALDLSGIEGDGVFGELEALLDEGGELADAAALLAEHLLRVGCADDDVGDGRGDADFDARVALLGQLALEELVQFGVEDTVCRRLVSVGGPQVIVCKVDPLLLVHHRQFQ